MKDLAEVRAEAEERRRALEQRWNAWQPRTTAQLLDMMAEEHPDRPYVVTDDHTYSYREIADLSTRLAAGLLAIGIEAGDHVAVDMANFPETIALKFAVGRVGATSVSVNFLLRHEELGYVVGQSRSKALITMDKFRDLDYLAELDQLIPGWEQSVGGETLPHLENIFVFRASDSQRGHSLNDLIALGQRISDEEVLEATSKVDPQSTSDLLYTSGTTGKAKGVLLQHDAVLRMAYSSAYTRAFHDGYRILYALPIYHVFGYIEATMAVLFVGGAAVPKTVFDVEDVLLSIGRHRVDELMAVPAMTTVLLETAKKGNFDLSSLGTMFSSGAAHRPSMWAEMYDTLGVDRIFTAYGQTETTASTMCTRPGDPLERLIGTHGCVKLAGLAGDPSFSGALAVYKVVDTSTGEELPGGQVGELLVRGPVVTRGYYDKHEETAALFTADGWMRTGDLGRIDESGYLTLTGRRKESYRFGGELVIPSEVEEVLMDYPGVVEAHVVGVPNERFGEVGCAWVVADSSIRPAVDDLTDYCRTRLARFKVPATILFIEASDIPRTVTGRVQKFHLVERAAEELSKRDELASV